METTTTKLAITIANSCGGGETWTVEGDRETVIAIARTRLEEQQLTADSSTVKSNIVSRERVAIAQSRSQQWVQSLLVLVGGFVAIVCLLQFCVQRRPSNVQSFSGDGAVGDGAVVSACHGRDSNRLAAKGWG